MWSPYLSKVVGNGGVTATTTTLLSYCTAYSKVDENFKYENL